MSVVRDKSCRFSLSNQSGSPQLSPQSQITTGSNSEAQLDDLKLPHGYNSPGMKGIKVFYIYCNICIKYKSIIYYRILYNLMEEIILFQSFTEYFFILL